MLSPQSPNSAPRSPVNIGLRLLGEMNGNPVASNRWTRLESAEILLETASKALGDGRFEFAITIRNYGSQRELGLDGTPLLAYPLQANAKGGWLEVCGEAAGLTVIEGNRASLRLPAGPEDLFTFYVPPIWAVHRQYSRAGKIELRLPDDRCSVELTHLRTMADPRTYSIKTIGHQEHAGVFLLGTGSPRETRTCIQTILPLHQSPNGEQLLSIPPESYVFLAPGLPAGWRSHASRL